MPRAPVDQPGEAETHSCGASIQSRTTTELSGGLTGLYDLYFGGRRLSFSRHKPSLGGLWKNLDSVNLVSRIVLIVFGIGCGLFIWASCGTSRRRFAGGVISGARCWSSVGMCCVIGFCGLLISTIMKEAKSVHRGAILT